ncbi:hypothetical protein [Ralstonia pseudosolanacearum]|uniref:Uncharacterized protein n=1 Tax=Ralstonia pseudosolanacearum TaxID=1310165 RepID=A0A454TLM3_9RALS|nr:hypothetical protein [Ralstonia pseudosolanacearum]RNM03017.1 hypothetical protein EGA29_19790 [Ralstonia pseudosolanacearum]
MKKKHAIAVVVGALISGSALAADAFRFDAFSYHLCQARSITALGVATHASEKKEQVEATLHSIEPPAPIDTKLALIADELIKAGDTTPSERSLEGLRQFLAGICYESAKAP